MIRLVSLLLLPALLFTACGTIVNGARQDINISSYPPGAAVKINGARVGTTPVILDMERKNDYRLRLELDGFIPYEMDIESKVSGWIAGNIIFGGLLGLVVDAITGGMYRLTPEQVMAELDATGAVMESGAIYIGVVLEPNPEWEKVGELEPVSSVDSSRVDQ